jgi:Transcriptional regulatory protein, C terminal
VAESNLTVQIARIRRVLDRDRSQGSCIQTVSGRGYRFTTLVSRPDQTTAGFMVLELSDKPSIAVLPFQNLSGDPDQEYFADGMAEEIITALSRIRWLFVVARNSSFTYKGKILDVKRVARELGVVSKKVVHLVRHGPLLERA